MPIKSTVAMHDSLQEDTWPSRRVVKWSIKKTSTHVSNASIGHGGRVVEWSSGGVVKWESGRVGEWYSGRLGL